MSNRLAHLLAEIKTVEADIRQLAGDAAAKALSAGHMLVEARTLVGHGGWENWLRNAGVSSRSARRYMTLARAGFKSATTKRLNNLRNAAGTPVWPRNYYEHIIRSHQPPAKPEA